MSDRPRPTKAERREQARLEREAIQARLERRARARRIGTALVLVGVLVAVAAIVLLARGGGTAEVPAPQALLQQADEAARAAACEEVRTTPPYGAQDRDHVATLPDLATYPSTPPASGPHGDFTLPAGVYDAPPPLDQVLHSLEHGAAVVWYDPALANEEIDRIEAFFSQPVDRVAASQDRVIVAPYDYPGQAGRLPDGVGMALVAWHRIRLCGEPSLAAAFDFTSRFAFPTALDRPYEGEAPEAGVPI
ncbi:MAG: hypothetical protein KatS3mg013_0910 [Actinomycetota bacterium]|nr:MAG: hypothetical protein KatS3mg013_0910 [Actinomycetota bacterium]